MRVTTSGAANRNVLYDRNPTNLTTTNFNSLGAAPHVSTQRWVYTVPTGRKAHVTAIRAYHFRNTAATTAGDINTTIQSANLFWTYLDFLNNTIGAAQWDDVAGPLFMFAGQSVACFTSDASTGGTVSYVNGAAVAEFDA